jgi:hypothetical protein
MSDFFADNKEVIYDCVGGVFLVVQFYVLTVLVFCM